MSTEPNPQPPLPVPPEPAETSPFSQITGNRLVLGCAAALVVLSFFAVGAGIGFGFGRLSASGVSPREAGMAIGGEQGEAAARDLRTDMEAKFGTFWEAIDVLNENFYGELPAGDSATYDAIRGVVNNLDDPNTSFLSPKEAEVFRTNLSGTFEGIGARVEWDVDADTVRIVEPFENQPAWNAGVRRDDLILAIDGETVIGTDLSSAVARIRGPKGSTVLLTLLRLGENDNQPFELEVTRDTIETPTVTTDRLGSATLGEEAIAYIHLYTFNENAGTLVKQAVEDAVARGAKGIILDLRGNAGGLLREAVTISGLFLEDEVVLYERFRNGDEEVYRTADEGVLTDLPLVVLVNEGSASASEIVAGALQDTGRAPLVGTITFGKGSVQLPESLNDGSIMRVTIARWFTPNDRTIDGVGLEPNFTVPLTDADREADLDPQLDRALLELEALITGVPFVPTPTPTPDAAAETPVTEGAVKPAATSTSEATATPLSTATPAPIPTAAPATPTPASN